MYFLFSSISPKYDIVIWLKFYILSALGAASSRWVGECFDFLHFFVHLLEDAAHKKIKWISVKSWCQIMGFIYVRMRVSDRDIKLPIW